ncbi:beta-N-acetylhexosaminidase [Granulicella pectinivorans]|nr:beta-N-acetylhexosaminidase [Granulicella pectinivorans]
MRFFRGLPVVALLSIAAVGSAQAPSLKLIPMPREVAVLPEQSLAGGVRVVCPGCDPQDQFAADDLSQTLAARGVPTGAGFTIQLARRSSTNVPATEAAEGYTISVNALTLTVNAVTEAGLFYGAQTVKQMIDGTGAKSVLHAATIRDWPAMKYRGLHDDLSRGPVPTLAFQKHLIQTLAAYKVNIYSPYYEETQQYITDPLASVPNGSISPADAKELSAFAAKYHITVLPEQEAFGHLRHILNWEQYAQVAETPHGAVLAPGQPHSLEIIKSWFTELAQDYPNSPFLHLGADETFDLGVGQTKSDVDARGRAAVYLDFMQNIVTALQPLHKKLLFWGDIAQDAPALLKAMPQNFKNQTIAVAWGYSPSPTGFAKIITPYSNAGIEVWVAPAINNYRQVYPNFNLGLPDVQQFTRDGQKYGATGQLNTLWNDDGESLADQNWYGLLFGAAAAWQQGESSIPAYQQAYGEVFHGDKTGKINQAQMELMAAMDLMTQAKVIAPTEGSDGLYWVDPWSPDGQKFAAKMRPLNAELRLHAEKAIQLIHEARNAAPAFATPKMLVAGAPALAYSDTPDPANAYPSNPTTLRESNALDAMEFGARRVDFLGLKFQLADEMAAGYARAQADIPILAQMSAQARRSDNSLHSVNRELSDINGVNGRLQDLIQAYSLHRDLFQQTWLRTNRPYALRPILERYDNAIRLWIARVDRFRSAQRQYSEVKTLPSASTLDIPPAPPVACCAVNQ